MSGQKINDMSTHTACNTVRGVRLHVSKDGVDRNGDLKLEDKP